MKLKGVLVSHFFANHTFINSQYLGSSWYRRLVTWASHYPSYSHLFSCSSTISGSLQFCYWSSIVTEPFFCLFAYKSSYTDSLREFIIKLRAAAPSSLYDSGEICQFFTIAVILVGTSLLLAGRTEGPNHNSTPNQHLNNKLANHNNSRPPGLFQPQPLSKGINLSEGKQRLELSYEAPESRKIELKFSILNQKAL